jgi:hypothetical protein
LPFGFALVLPFGFSPRDGGLLQLSGVFGGRFSFFRSVAFSARNTAFSAFPAQVHGRSTRSVDFRSNFRT